LESEPMDRHASLAMTTIAFERFGNGSSALPVEVTCQDAKNYPAN
jgi:hypothetical protein